MNSKDKKTLTKVLTEMKGLTLILEAEKEIARQREIIQQLMIKLEPLTETVEGMADKEREAYEDKSDKWKESYRGELQNELANYLERAHDSLYDCKSYLESCLDDY